MSELAPHAPRVIRVAVRTGTVLGRDTRSMAESARLGWFALTEAITGFYWTLAMVLRTVGLGATFPAQREMARNTARQLAWAGSGERASYRPLPHHEGKGLEPLKLAVEDPARARDLGWHLVNPVATALGLLVQAVTLGLGTIFLAGVVSTLGGYGILDGLRYLLFGYGSAAGPVALVGGPLALWITPKLARLQQFLHRRWVLRKLSPQEETLTRRVEKLTTTRRTALELQEEEIRRIERDLHDGAQARIVSMGMTLTQVQRLMEVDPSGARQLLASAKEDSSAALGELRSLVRGIRPPILADRGLTAALQSLAAGCPIDTRVASSLTTRLVPTLETALYFAVTELTTNAVKHSAATELVIELGAANGLVTAVVTDNGIGGLTERPGGGLGGLRQRLAPFDGTLEWISPVGGPTVATVQVPLPVD